MSKWPPPAGMDPDDELRAADALLDKADALLRRRNGGTVPSEADVLVALDDDELPILTDIVDPSDLSANTGTVPARQAPASRPADLAAERRAEQLVSLDTEISREVETWFANELPQLLSRELDKLSERLQEEALAHLRATLLPALSERISLDLTTPPEAQ